MAQPAATLIPVVLCGGSGSRLWPLSRRQYPKQFVPIGGGVDLFRRTLDRVAALDAAAPIFVCNDAQRFFVRDALSGTAFADAATLVEPVSRNTAPAIALAALQATQDGGDPVLLALPSDHLVNDVETFARQARVAARRAAAGEIVCFGIPAARPETGFGYIHPGEALEPDMWRVRAFHEKPDRETAARWVAAGDCFWNSGMFVFGARTMLRELERHAPAALAAARAAFDARAEDLGFVRVARDAFAAAPDISIDYAVMEKTAPPTVVSAKFDWSDMGSWTAVGELLERGADGNATFGDVVLEASRDNIVYAGGRLVALVGVADCVVAETADAVLVAGREHAGGVKRLVEALRRRGHPAADAHRKVFRPWGSYETVDIGDGFQVKRIIVNPGHRLSLQKHHRRSEHWVIVDGRVRVTRDDETLELGHNESVYIPLGARHRLENIGDAPAHLIEVQCGDYLGEDDIVRFEDAYGRAAD